MKENKIITHDWLATKKTNYDLRYQCNRACNVTEEKLIDIGEIPTCKNCLQRRNNKLRSVSKDN